ncbi:MAG: GWxTD domain-containing protein [Bacteriodetes bacterium]|nr:GWxTD domain-containing protein [Bacteroidota bacterium]
MAQPVFTADQPTVLISALSFKGDTPDSARVDVYAAMPFQLLQFVSANNKLGAKYNLQITLRDSTGNKVTERKIERKVVETDYEVSRGSTGRADVTQTIFNALPGSYRVEVFVTDIINNREFSASRRFTVPAYTTQEFAVSSPMIVSAIEQKDDGYIITPYINDNIGNLPDGFFVFFEAYNKRKYDTLDFAIELYDGTKQVYKTIRQPFAVKEARTQQFIKVNVPGSLPAGSYTLKAIAVSVTAPKNYNESDYLASSQRQIVVERGIAGTAVSDIDKAIRQLRYVATQSEIDSIQSPSSPEERRKRFEAFWKQLDPSPNTIRNEAFEEYYARVDYANKNYRSYNDGWLTDMGMIHIVLGAPSTSDRRVNTYDGRTSITWTYSGSNRRFVFIDNTGFGDYRLSPSTPFPMSEKYKYTGM